MSEQNPESEPIQSDHPSEPQSPAESQSPPESTPEPEPQPEANQAAPAAPPEPLPFIPPPANQDAVIQRPEPEPLDPKAAADAAAADAAVSSALNLELGVAKVAVPDEKPSPPSNEQLIREARGVASQLSNIELSAAFNALSGFGMCPFGNKAHTKLVDAKLVRPDGQPVHYGPLLKALDDEITHRTVDGKFS